MTNEISGDYTVEQTEHATCVSLGNIKAYIRLKLVNPVIRSSGKTHRNFFSFHDMLLIKTIACLGDGGVKRNKAKEVEPHIRSGEKGTFIVTANRYISVHIHLDSLTQDIKERLPE